MPRAVTPLISDAVSQYIQVRARHRTRTGKECHSTTYTLRSLLHRLIGSTGPIHIGSLTASHLEHFYYGAGGLTETAQAATLGNYRNTLKAFLTWCHVKEWTRKTPEQLLSLIHERLTRVTTNQDRYRLAVNQIQALAAAATNPRDLALLMFIANTGCRVSEAKHLRWRDINLTAMDVYVTLVKTDTEVTVPMTGDLTDALRLWQQQYSEQATIQPHYRVFPAFQGRRLRGSKASAPYRLNPEAPLNNPAIIIKELAAASGVELPKGDAWHAIRRSFATIYYERLVAERDPEALRLTQEALHHKNVTTTMVYLGTSREKERYQDSLRGQRFISAAPAGEVINLRSRWGNVA